MSGANAVVFYAFIVPTSAVFLWWYAILAGDSAWTYDSKGTGRASEIAERSRPLKHLLAAAMPLPYFVPGVGQNLLAYIAQQGAHWGSYRSGFGLGASWFRSRCLLLARMKTVCGVCVRLVRRGR